MDGDHVIAHANYYSNPSIVSEAEPQEQEHHRSSPGSTFLELEQQQQQEDRTRPNPLNTKPTTMSTEIKHRRYYSSPVNNECQSTPVELYGLETRQPSIVERPKLLNRFSSALDDIKEDIPLQLDPRNTAQKIRRRTSSMLVLDSSTVGSGGGRESDAADRGSMMPGAHSTGPSPAPPSRTATVNNVDINGGSTRSHRKESLSAREKFGRRLSILSLGSVRRKGSRSHGLASISQPDLLGSSNEF